MEKLTSLPQSPDRQLTLPPFDMQALSVQAFLLISASFFLPAAAHLAGLPIRKILPMHWPVLLVGLLYGWRSGLIVGLAAPNLSYLISGMPYPKMLPAMTVELGFYGLLAGVFREKLRWNSFLAMTMAIVTGRLVFLIVAYTTRATGASFLNYLYVAMTPGILTAFAQILLLPLLATWWLQRSAKK